MLKEYMKEILETCEEKGWNIAIESRTEGEWAALVHTEISEAFESYRNNEPLFFVKDNKPEGAAIEYIDAIIRILHWFAIKKIDPDVMMRDKLEYNKTRSFRHGGKIV